MIFQLTKKFFKYFLYIIFSYFIIAFSTYTISAIFLVKDKILNYKVLINYQRNFYHQLGFRKIWQAQSECVDYDKELIYVPRIGKCLFKNPEFTTELNFTKEGRQTGNNLISDSKGVAVIGDSMAMGWGVPELEACLWRSHKARDRDGPEPGVRCAGARAEPMDNGVAIWA